MQSDEESNALSSDQDQVPEPQEQFKLMQEQFSAMMHMMEASERRNEERHSSLKAENMLLRDEMVAGGQLEDTPKKVHLGRLTGTKPTPAVKLNPGRRSSMYYGNTALKPTPKVLVSGDVFTKMPKYGGKAHESIQEHFITFEYHARNQEDCFWCDLLQLTFSKTIHTAIVNHGLTLRAGRNAARDCPSGWYDYEELKLWVKKKYHRDQFQMELLSRIFFSYDQTGTLDAYLSLLDTKMATCETKFSDSLKKVLVLQKMCPQTRAVMATKPETYTQSYTEFCHRALLEYDSLQITAKSSKKATPVQPKNKYSNSIVRELASFVLLDKHTLKSGKKTFTSPWKPGNDRYKTDDKPPCNYCKEMTHNMRGCAVLWLRYYGQLSETEEPRPDFVVQYLLTHDIDEIAALSCSSSDEEEELDQFLHSFVSDQDYADQLRAVKVSCGNKECVNDTDVEKNVCINPVTRAQKQLAEKVTSTEIDFAVPAVPPPTGTKIQPYDVYKVPNSLIAGHDSRDRMLLDCTIGGVPCKALLDTGSCVTGVSIDWFTRSGISHSPSPVRPFTCRSVTDHGVNTTEQLLDCEFSIGNYKTLENFALLPISKTYQAILGKDAIRHLGLCLDFKQDAEHAVIVQNPPRTMASTTVIGSILPEWSDDADIIGNVFDLDMGALTADKPSKGHEFVAVTHKKFNKLRKHEEKKARKRLARAEKAAIKAGVPVPTSTLSITKFVCLALCLAASAALGDAADTNITSVNVDSSDYSFAQDRAFSIGATEFAVPDQYDGEAGFLDRI